MRESLSAQGYTATLCGPDDAHPCTHLVTLSHNSHTIAIDYQHTLEECDWAGQQLGIVTVDVKVSSSRPLQLVLPQAQLGDPRVPHCEWAVDASLGSGGELAWGDSIPWRKSFGFREANLKLSGIPGGGPTVLTATLGLTFATTNYYLLHIELETADIS